MNGQIITIFGGTGFLGRYVVKQLARSGYRLRVITRKPGIASDIKTFGDTGQITILSGNINNPETYKSALKGSFAVINLVGLLFEKGSQNFNDIHAIAAEKLAVSSKAAKVERFIHVSALAVDHESGSSYARTKFLGEKAILSAFHQATILRPSIIFGAEDNFFNQFAKMASISPVLPLIGGGKTLFQPVYVGDVARAIDACLTLPESKGEIYELGGTNVYYFKQILQYILAETGKKRFLVPLSFNLASIIGRIGELLPIPPLTRDQVKLLRFNNIIHSKTKTLTHLGIVPTSVEAIVPKYLSIYRKK